MATDQQERTDSGPPPGHDDHHDHPPHENRENNEAQGHHDEKPPEPPLTPAQKWRRWLIGGAVAAVVLGVALYFGIPYAHALLTTEWTDDAYVNSHVSQVGPRVAGYITGVYADENDSVKKGDLLIELDHTPYRVTADQKRAALEVSEANLAAAVAQARSQEASARANWFNLVNAQEQVRYTIEVVRSNIANLKLQEANLDLTQKELTRVRSLRQGVAVAREEVDQRLADVEVARQKVNDARETIHRTRASLGLPTDDEHPDDFPKDLDQKFSLVQTSMSGVIQSLAQLGLQVELHGLTPKRLYDQLLDMDPARDLNRTLDRLVASAPAVKQARANRDQAREDLRSAELNLSYTWVYAPIDGVVSKRNVNPGNFATQGQGLLTVRSLTEVWVDANFKESQLATIRVGQPVDVRVDAYPKKVFRGRVFGFAPATGSASALLPAENATGNYVKIVQRLPVRISVDPEDITDDTPLLVGLSVVPTVKVKEEPTGPNAGKRLSPVIKPPHRGPADEPPGAKPSPTSPDNAETTGRVKAVSGGGPLPKVTADPKENDSPRRSVDE